MAERTVSRRKPRYILGTFWLILAVAAIIGGISGGKVTVILVGLAILAYSVYLYRGGRFGLFIW
jgi:hypothetical protein